MLSTEENNKNKPQPPTTTITNQKTNSPMNSLRHFKEGNEVWENKKEKAYIK